MRFILNYKKLEAYIINHHIRIIRSRFSQGNPEEGSEKVELRKCWKVAQSN